MKRHRITGKKRANPNRDDRGELLVALLKEVSDFAILREEGWYRIPVETAPKRWPPKWLAFYLPKAFKDEAYSVRYFGKVADIQVVNREELFPNEFESTLSSKQYYRLTLKSLETLEKPIPSFRPRRLLFIPTTYIKFLYADQINDLFDDSPLEDALWMLLKRLMIQAERQWVLFDEGRRYFLDFAIFCHKAPFAIETNGDTWHSVPQKANQDYIRQNFIETQGWHILRFNSKEIRETMDSYCMPEIQTMINQLGGLSDEGLVPRRFFPKTGATQLSLFEEAGTYTMDTGADENLEFD